MNSSMEILEDHIETLKGFAFKSSLYSVSGIPIVKVSDFTQDSVTLDKISFIPVENGPDFEKYKLKKGDVLIQTVGSWEHNPNSVVGKVVRIPEILNDSLLNQNIVRIIPKATLENQFLYYLLRNDVFKNYIINTAQGAANQASITLESIRAFKFNYKNKSTQYKIASILSAYDDLIENNFKRIKLLEESTKLSYKLLMESESLSEIRLSRIASVNELSMKANSQLEKIIYIDISSVTEGSINEKREYDLKDAPGRAKRIVKHEDIIWSCVRPNRKSFSMVWLPEENLIVSTGFAVITSKKIPSTFLYQSITTDEFVKYLEANAKGAAYPAVGSKEFEDAKLLLPSDVAMIEYHQKHSVSFTLINNLQKQNAKLREARDILLPRLMSGEIEV